MTIECENEEQEEGSSYLRLFWCLDKVGHHTCLAGFGFYFLGELLSDGDLKNLLMNISAALFAIPVILFFYETIKGLSENKLNKEIFEYGKMQVDREAMGVISQLMKTLYPLEQADRTFKGFNKFLTLSKDEIRENLIINEYFGFQVFRAWDSYQENLENILKNVFIIKKLDSEQVIAIITILKNIRAMEDAQKTDEMFIATGKKLLGYKLVKGDSINPSDIEHPDRFLLLKHLTGDKFVVIDFPDIPKYNEEKAFKTYKVNPVYLDFFTETIFDFTTALNKWISLTGNEFLVDTKAFRLGLKLREQSTTNRT